MVQIELYPGNDDSIYFYLTYIIFPIPIAWMIHKHGYKISLLVALITCTVGCLVFWPAQVFNSYGLVLVAIFIISTGITIINVAANPFATMLGILKALISA